VKGLPAPFMGFSLDRPPQVRRSCSRLWLTPCRNCSLQQIKMLEVLQFDCPSNRVKAGDISPGYIITPATDQMLEMYYYMLLQEIQSCIEI
jgi:hypothetical protein